MHKAFFTRFATAGIAVAPLTLVSALIWIDGSHAGQTSGQRGLAVAPETTAQTGTLTKPRPVPPLRPADPTLDSIGYSAEALVFGRASDPDATPAPTRSAITPTGLRGRQDGSTEPGHADQWAADLAPSAHAASPYGRHWIGTPQAFWNAGQPGVSRAFTAPTGTSGSSVSSGTTPGSENPASGPSAPGTPQLFYAPDNPVAVLTAASPGATPAESSGEPLALLAAPVITARNATSQAVPEPSTLGLALGALGLAGLGRCSRRPARRSGG